MKFLAMIDRVSETPAARVDLEVQASAISQGLDQPTLRAGWRRDLGTHQEICTEFFPGARPVWIWEV